jgi:hypothetical protein
MSAAARPIAATFAGSRYRRRRTRNVVAAIVSVGLRVAVLWVTVPVAAKARGLPRARVNHRNVTVLSRMVGAPPQQEINEPTNT